MQLWVSLECQLLGGKTKEKLLSILGGATKKVQFLFVDIELGKCTSKLIFSK